MWPYPWTHVGTPSHLGHMDQVAVTMPSQAHAGAAQEAPDIGQLEGQDVPLVRPSSCNVQGGIPSSRRYLPTYLYVCMYVYGYIYMCVCVCVCVIYMFIYICVCVCVFVCVCIYLYTYIHIYIYIYIYIYSHSHSHNHLSCRLLVPTGGSCLARSRGSQGCLRWPTA